MVDMKSVCVCIRMRILVGADFKEFALDRADRARCRMILSVSGFYLLPADRW